MDTKCPVYLHVIKCTQCSINIIRFIWQVLYSMTLKFSQILKRSVLNPASLSGSIQYNPEGIHYILSLHIGQTNSWLVFFFIKILKFQTEVNYFELNSVNVALRPLTIPLIVLNPKLLISEPQNFIS